MSDKDVLCLRFKLFDSIMKPSFVGLPCSSWSIRGYVMHILLLPRSRQLIDQLWNLSPIPHHTRYQYEISCIRKGGGKN